MKSEFDYTDEKAFIIAALSPHRRLNIETLVRMGYDRAKAIDWIRIRGAIAILVEDGICKLHGDFSLSLKR